MLTEFKLEKKKKKAPPSNVISGIFKGTTIFVGSVLDGVSGVVIKPIVGAKDGVKGVTKGIGKGILGLICKPIAGSIDMVTYTVRGIGNTPGTIYVGAKKIFTRKAKRFRFDYKYAPIRPYIPGEEEEEEDNVLIGRDDDGDIYVDRKQLMEVLLKKGLGNSLSRIEESKNESSKDGDSVPNSELEFEEDVAIIIKELVRKKKLNRIIRHRADSGSEYFSCLGSVANTPSSLTNQEDIEIYLMKPVEIKQYDESSI